MLEKLKRKNEEITDFLNEKLEDEALNNEILQCVNEFAIFNKKQLKQKIT
jgi:hypothetical protein